MKHAIECSGRRAFDQCLVSCRYLVPAKPAFKLSRTEGLVGVPLATISTADPCTSLCLPVTTKSGQRRLADATRARVGDVFGEGNHRSPQLLQCEESARTTVWAIGLSLFLPRLSSTGSMESQSSGRCRLSCC